MPINDKAKGHGELKEQKKAIWAENGKLLPGNTLGTLSAGIEKPRQGKLFDIVRELLEEVDPKKKKKKKVIIMEKLLQSAEKGQRWAHELILDRYDGRVPLALDGTGDVALIPLLIERPAVAAPARDVIDAQAVELTGEDSAAVELTGENSAKVSEKTE